MATDTRAGMEPGWNNSAMQRDGESWPTGTGARQFMLLGAGATHLQLLRLLAQGRLRPISWLSKSCQELLRRT